MDKKNKIKLWLNHCIQLVIPEKDMGLMELNIGTVEYKRIKSLTV